MGGRGEKGEGMQEEVRRKWRKTGWGGGEGKKNCATININS